jgi:hypothetical protein
VKEFSSELPPSVQDSECAQKLIAGGHVDAWRLSGQGDFQIRFHRLGGRETDAGS